MDPRFELLEKIGHGGMGAVFRARELSSGRELALKFVLEQGANAQRLQRFHREGEIAARLRHPGIVAVHSAGDFEGRPFLAYELVSAARSLDDAWEGLGPRERAGLLAEAARAVGYAHEQGVVHRDLKPENILVGGDGRVRVADFGLAHAGDLERLTRSGQFVGSPLYMAPEMVSGKSALSPSADVWSLGVVLYEALTGEVPFEDQNLAALLARLLSAPVEPPSERGSEVPAALETICLRALQRDPAARYPNAGALADDLERFLRGESVVAAAAGRPSLPLAILAGLSTTAVALLLALGLAASGGPPPDAVPSRAEIAAERTAPEDEELGSPGVSPPTLAERVPDPPPEASDLLIQRHAKALAGDGRALHDLASDYHEGKRGHPEDEPRAMSLFFAAAEIDYPSSQLHLGDWFVNVGNYESAVHYLRRAARKDRRAWLRLGNLYLAGLGLPRDRDEAIRSYRKAQDMRPALMQLADLLLDRAGPGDREEALEALARAHQRDEQSAALRFARVVLDHELDDVYPDRALRMLSPLRENGQPDALALSGHLALYGGDREEALEWLRAALSRPKLDWWEFNEWAGLRVNWAHWLIEGLLMEPNIRRAAQLLLPPAREGHLDSQAQLARVMEVRWLYEWQARSKKVELRRAIKPVGLLDEHQAEVLGWFKALARAGQSGGELGLASARHFGWGVSRSQPLALALYERAATREPLAAFWLSIMHWRGLGTPKDPATSIEWLRRSAQGDYPPAPALFRLGGVYERGTHVERDPKQALKLLSSAARRGHPEAALAAARLAAEGGYRKRARRFRRMAERWGLKAERAN